MPRYPSATAQRMVTTAVTLALVDRRWPPAPSDRNTEARGKLAGVEALEVLHLLALVPASMAVMVAVSAPIPRPAAEALPVRMVREHLPAQLVRDLTLAGVKAIMALVVLEVTRVVQAAHQELSSGLQTPEGLPQALVVVAAVYSVEEVAAPQALAAITVPAAAEVRQDSVQHLARANPASSSSPTRPSKAGKIESAPLLREHPPHPPAPDGRAPFVRRMVHGQDSTHSRSE